ncbi:MAG: pyridoxal phosphate-dependent aminotransferase [Gammaproteobacteria bacterium]|nr:pyridoxal phosphate-dependent aminotransferase [Gammaproteobacteria bacterium]NIR82491.1 pyridoxal phosphate-dependent aminotransferase [Gammaproteobacteria bacterium]NIR88487.1 pyridoxal phosphate-dependent aminotransferase [Gammaproteobacteria bacterium]NIU03627.1 pyridoxal phosphate-dependent aminotransferase [Gammaproteobacteria bacterium]NIV50979.1 pyridoxal phosphate-dependent aminotransferase [Gammaproteobacteria bacterium]
MRDIAPFHVMDVLARAAQLEAQGRRIIHMEVGEPDFPTAEPIVAAGQRALASGHTHYTPACGIQALREAIARHYGDRYGVEVAPERVVVTAGASGALLLIMGVLVNPGQSVLMADPGYPCNRHFVRVFEGRPVSIPAGPEVAYQLTADLIERYAEPETVAVMLASPSNPTGTMVAPEDLQGILRTLDARGLHLVADEIYQGLVYGGHATTALGLSGEAFVVNSFSKYFGMTGWRLGWLVGPEAFVRDVEKLAQNLFISPPTPAQHAALAAFEPDTLEILEERRRAFETRRDFLLAALRELGFSIPIEPAGAFYLYAGCERFTNDSQAFALDVLERAGVAFTPGLDFGRNEPERHVRFAYTTGLAELEEGVERLRRYLG